MNFKSWFKFGKGGKPNNVLDPPTVMNDRLSGNDVLTHSSMAMFKGCKRKYFYAYEMGWRPKQKSRALRLGSAYHEGLDAMACHKSMEEVYQLIDGLYDGEIDKIAKASYTDRSEIDRTLLYESETVKSLLIGYQAAWGDSQIEIIESEKKYHLPIINPASGRSARVFAQEGRRDRIGRLPDGRLALMEAKTTSEDMGPDSDYRLVLNIDQQITKYFLAARTEGIEIDTVMYDVTRKPSIKPSRVNVLDHGIKIVKDANGERVFKKDGKPRMSGDKDKGYTLQTRPMTPEEWSAKLSADIANRPTFYYARFEVPRLQSDLDEFQGELWDTAQDIHACKKTNRWYRTTGPTSCKKFGRLCEYHSICSGQCAVEAGVPAGFRQAENAHEELIEPEENEVV